jgi:chemotaxis signal transduction protein
VTAYVHLRVAAESYAIPAEHVYQVASLDSVTAVPGSPSGVLGVRSLRGQILPVLDLAVLLGIGRKAPPASLLVAEAGGCLAGFAVDEVSSVGELEDPAEETESGLLAGATLAHGDLIGVIDVARVFDLVGSSGGE